MPHVRLVPLAGRSAPGGEDDGGECPGSRVTASWSRPSHPLRDSGRAGPATRLTVAGPRRVHTGFLVPPSLVAHMMARGVGSVRQWPLPQRRGTTRGRPSPPYRHLPLRIQSGSSGRPCGQLKPLPRVCIVQNGTVSEQPHVDAGTAHSARVWNWISQSDFRGAVRAKATGPCVGTRPAVGASQVPHPIRPRHRRAHVGGHGSGRGRHTPAPATWDVRPAGARPVRGVPAVRLHRGARRRRPVLPPSSTARPACAWSRRARSAPGWCTCATGPERPRRHPSTLSRRVPRR